MKQNDNIDMLSKDAHLREAISRRERKQPPMPTSLNEQLLERIETTGKAPKRRPAWLYPAIAASIVVALLIGSSIFRSEEEEATNVCYTIENGQRITDRSIVMSRVETTLSDIFTTDK